MKTNIMTLLFTLLLGVGALNGMEKPEIPVTQTVQIKGHSILRGELKEREDDLSDNDWIEIINIIASKLQDIYLPDINIQSIEQFKQDMFQNKFSLANLRKALNDNFGIGHLGIAREEYDKMAGLFLMHLAMQIKDPERAEKLKVAAFSSEDGKPFGYLIDPSQVTIKDIENYIDSSKRITIKLLKSNKGEVPIVTVPTFSIKQISQITMLRGC